MMYGLLFAKCYVFLFRTKVSVCVGRFERVTRVLHPVQSRTEFFW
jgi:hypothetical protein